MSWQGTMSEMVRHIIDDVDPSNYTFDQERIEKTILVAAQMLSLEVDFENTYTINIEGCSLSPDPSDSPVDESFLNLVTLKAACIITASEFKTQARQAVSANDGKSSIDKRGVAAHFAVIYKDVCNKLEEKILEYKMTGGATGDSPGKAVLGPYSPGSAYANRNNYSDDRSGGYFNY